MEAAIAVLSSGNVPVVEVVRCKFDGESRELGELSRQPSRQGLGDQNIEVLIVKKMRGSKMDFKYLSEHKSRLRPAPCTSTLSDDTGLAPFAAVLRPDLALSATGPCTDQHFRMKVSDIGLDPWHVCGLKHLQHNASFRG